MRIPQVTDRINTDRIKEAPAQALRAVFAGIGQLLVVADRIRKQGSDQAEAGQRAGGPDRGSAGEGASAQDSPARDSPTQASPAQASPAQASPAQASPAQASPVKARRSLDQTGNVRLLSADDLADDLPVPAASPPPAESATDTDPADAIAADASPAGTGDLANPVGEAALPVPNYDSLTLPSLRARLRTLDAHQLRVLTEYERSHAARADVVAMFERRIAKLAAEG